jgi:hypothetical protein
LRPPRLLGVLAMGHHERVGFVMKGGVVFKDELTRR